MRYSQQNSSSPVKHFKSSDSFSFCLDHFFRKFDGSSLKAPLHIGTLLQEPSALAFLRFSISDTGRVFHRRHSCNKILYKFWPYAAAGIFRRQRSEFCEYNLIFIRVTWESARRTP